MSLNIEHLYKSTSGIKLINGDCISLMEKIPENSDNIIYSDPPYNIQQNSDLLRPKKSTV